MTERVQAAAEATGGLLIVLGVGLIYVPAALIVAGAVLLAVGNLPAPGRR